MQPNWLVLPIRFPIQSLNHSAAFRFVPTVARLLARSLTPLLTCSNARLLSELLICIYYVLFRSLTLPVAQELTPQM